jgi:hypothetical protein
VILGPKASARAVYPRASERASAKAGGMEGEGDLHPGSEEKLREKNGA